MPRFSVSRLLEVIGLFLRLGVTAFGGPAAHIALLQRECVERRRWISPERFLGLLGVANLIPGPTSTELAMHIGRERAGWVGLVAGGLAFIVPAALMVGALAAFYVRGGELPVTRGVLFAVQPVVIVVVLQALVPLGRSAIRSVPMAMLAVAVAMLALAGIPEIRILLLAGVVHLAVARPPFVAPALAALVGVAGLHAAQAAGAIGPIGLPDVGGYFLRVGSVLFGSGYVLLPVLEGDLVDRYRWLTEQQLFDAIAAGQATPGPLFTTATFVGYLLGGVAGAAAATAAIFLPAFVFSALASTVVERLGKSPRVRVFLQGVNCAAVGLIAVTLVTLARGALTGLVPIGIALVAVVAVFVVRLNSALVLAAAALGGALFTLL